MKKLVSILFFIAIYNLTATAESHEPNTKKKIPGHVTSVQQWLGMPTFMLDGKPFTKPIFETYAPETKYFKDFADAGCNVYSFSTNLGNGFGPPCWVGPEQWDFSELDARAHRVLEADPNALIIPRILVWAPEWWKKQNPDELLVLDDGSKVFRKETYESVASEKWRIEMAEGLRTLVEHMQNSDYADHMFGYMVAGMATEEWYHRVLNSEPLADYSKANTLAFQKWLKKKYGAQGNLQESWNDPKITFEAVKIPSKAQRMGDKDKTFRDVKTDMNIIDFYLFNGDIVPDTIDYFAKVVKDVTGNTKVVGAFYGFMFEFTGDPEFGHNAMSKYIDSPNLDFMMVTASYGNRFIGKGADYVRSPATTVTLHKKLWYHDNDTISYLYPKVMSRMYSTEQAEYEGSRLGGTKTAQESLWLYQRSAGFVLGWGFFQSFFDLHGGYYHSPELVEGFSKLYKIFDDSKNYPRTSISQILVVSDETSCAYAGFRPNLLDHALYHPQSNLTKIGAPHDSILTDDLALVNMDQYKLVVFLNPYHLTDAQRKLIADKVLQKGKTVLWCYAPGLFNGNQMNEAAMEKLTGIKIAVSSEIKVPKTKIVESDNPLAKALKAEGLSVMGPGTTYVQPTGAFEKRGRGGAEKSPSFVCQLFFVNDSDAATVGTLIDEKAVTLAVKNVNGWTSIYAINPNLPAAFYRVIAKQAGVHIYSDTDETIYVSKSYLTFCAEKAGKKIIKLPQKSDVIDPLTGQALYKGVKEFTKDFQANETLLVRIKAAE